MTCGRAQLPPARLARQPGSAQPARLRQVRVLVTSGAGYIGSHTVVHLIAAGHQPVIVDDFRNAQPVVLDRLASLTGREIECHRFDVTDAPALDRLLAGQPVDAVIHFAGLKAVAESVTDPLAYYRTNVTGTIAVLETLRRHGVDVLIFSSSATVYGPDGTPPMTEDAPLAASNPYGWTKIMSEQILRDAATQHSPRRIALLRYFNPAGAHPSRQLGEDPRDVPSDLVPYIARVAAGRSSILRIFGDNYPTPDGTCLRDYIHVEDLAAGHVAALAALATGTPAIRTWNLGTGWATSVLEMVHTFERVVGRSIPYEIVDRRPGDVPISYADVGRAHAELGWVARRTIDDMCADAWRWQSR